MASEYKLRYEGTYITKGAYEFKAGAPLDTRSVVSSLKHLISASVWENVAEYTYNGLPVYVEGALEYYQLKSKIALKANLFDDATLDNMDDATVKEHVDLCWDRMAYMADVEELIKDLGPVFRFKGVAQDISFDKRVITVDEVSYIPYGESESVSISCLSYEYGFPDEYYAWGKVDEDGTITTYFYTDSSVVTPSTEQYKKDDTSISVFYIDDGAIRFYFDGSVENQDASAEVGVDKIMWEFTDETDEIHVYCVAEGQEDEPTQDASSVVVYTTPDTSEEPYVEGLAIEHFTTYTFSPLENPGTIESAEAQTIIASDENNGWVYQIGEDEYASNGYIWVQLGSPTDQEWIVI